MGKFIHQPGKPMVTIQPIQIQQVPEARRMIFTVAASIFHPHEPVEEVIAHYEVDWGLRDLQNVEQHYFQNRGTFLVTIDGNRIVGTGAIRFYDEETCELKRMWLLPEYHGQGLGYRMITILFDAAREMGYRKIRLMTDPNHQQQAVAFYHKVGFVEIPPYGDDPSELSMERSLT
jgi:putative acetyltransferase